jgi:hypothetical protein
MPWISSVLIICQSTRRANTIELAHSSVPIENQALAGLRRLGAVLAHHSGVYDSGKCSPAPEIELFQA